MPLGKVIAVIPAAGSGSRMSSAVKKQYMHLLDKPVIRHTLDIFEQCSEIDGIILVVAPGEEAICQDMINQGNDLSKIMAVVPGGNHRQTSVYYGLSALPQDAELALIHDGARPLVRSQEITEVIEVAREMGAAALAVQVKDTIKVVNQSGIIVQTPQRESLWAVQTPQVFRYPLIMQAHRQAMAKGYFATDDCALVEALGLPVKLVPGSYENLKITTPEDLVLAEAFMKRRKQ